MKSNFYTEQELSELGLKSFDILRRIVYILERLR